MTSTTTITEPTPSSQPQVIPDVPLTKEMVGVRINQIQSTQYGYYATLLLHQEPRASMSVLDRLYPGWQRTHQKIGDSLFCTISVYNPSLKTWISRQDVGTAGEFEKDKSEATDSFKRAVVNFIPALRALYNAPQIRIKLRDDEVSQGANGHFRCYTKFEIQELEYDSEKQIFTSLLIIDEKGNVRFDVKGQKTAVQAAPKVMTITQTQPATNVNSNTKIDKTLTASACQECGKKISPKVSEFSQRRYGRPLCMECQKSAQAAA